MTTHVVMYTSAVCPYCQRAEALLKARGVSDIEKIMIDLEPARRDEMVTRTGRRSVPQIFIGEKHVGGFDELSALDRDGKLTPLLAA
jgi:glutaredoxin 3